MKKIVFALVALMFAAPAFAEVNISWAQVGTTDEVVVSFDATSELSSRVRAFSLDIQLNNDATIIEVIPVMVGVCTQTEKGYGIFPGTIQIDAGGNITNPGSPAAEYDDLQSDTLPGIDSNGVTIELASLYAPVGSDANAPLKSGPLFSIRVSGDCCMTMTANVSRAGPSGVVMEDPDEDPTVNLPPELCVSLGPEDCFDSGHPDYAEWADVVGKPTSWCYKYQCYGDADGIRNGNIFTGYSRVRVEDLNILISGWKIEDYVDEATHPWIAADFDRTLNGNIFTGFSRIRVEDLNILVANWKDDSGIPMENPNCGGDIDLTPP